MMRPAIEGGVPTRPKPWPTYDKGDVILDKEDEKLVVEALKSKLLFRYDYRPLEQTHVGKFEKSAEKFFNVKYALAVSSGTAAITLALISLDLKQDDEVALPGFTFAATPSAVILAGAKPVLVEVDENLNFDIRDLEKKYNPKMKAVIPVHMRGSASDMEAIAEFAYQRGLSVIEDVVQAMGLKYKGRYLGTYGHFGAFSMQSDKGCNTGEGGLLVTNDDRLFAKSAILSGAYEGRWKSHFDSRHPDLDDRDYPVYSFRMDNLRGALAYSQLKKLPARLKKLSSNYSYLIKQLSKNPKISIRKSLEQESIIGDSLLFSLPEFTLDEALYFSNALRAEGISCLVFGDTNRKNIRRFWDWNFLFPELDVSERKKLLPNTVKYLENVMDIPLSPTLAKTDLDDIVLATEKVLRYMDARRGMVVKL